MSASDKLAELGLTLPPVAAPLAAYVPAVREGQQVWTAGQLPLVGGTLEITGKVGADVTAEEATQLARTACLNALAAIADQCGGIDNITRVLKVVVFVASDPSFTGQPAVANGASELLGELFGDAGVHARSAVGVSVLPMDAPVELDVVAMVA